VISELIYRLENFAKDEIDIMTETASQFDIISSGEESPTIRLYCEVLVFFPNNHNNFCRKI
jgi:hypothetical protein